VNVQELLERARLNSLTVFLKDGKLKVVAPQEPGSEAKALIQELRQHKEEILEALNPEDDPMLTPDHWYLEFHHFHLEVVRSTPDLDWEWIREHRSELFEAIRQKEDKLERLGDARLSEVMAIMGEWRGLILKAEFERFEASKAQPDQGDLDLKAKGNQP